MLSKSDKPSTTVSLEMRFPERCTDGYINNLPEDSFDRQVWCHIRKWYDKECLVKSNPESTARLGLVLIGKKQSKMLEWCQSLVHVPTVELIHVGRIFTKAQFTNQDYAKVIVLDGHPYDAGTFHGALKHICGGGWTNPISTTRYNGGLPAIVLCYEEDQRSLRLAGEMHNSDLFKNSCYYIDVTKTQLI